jgi:type VI secretion system protein ImpK
MASQVIAVPEKASAPARAGTPRRGALAATLQEPFTVAVRLRTRRQVAANADLFRAHLKQLLGTADREARAAGYDPELVRLAIYAFIAFLDESVLNSGQPMFADWPRQPLQEEVFGEHVAGENFFRNLSSLMARLDAEDVADTLEVYQLCMLLGFRGRYAADPGGLQAVLHAVRDKIQRIRGGLPAFAPDWAPPQGEVPKLERDSWVPRLAIAAAAALVLAVVLYFVFRSSLGSAVADLGTAVAGLAP